MTEIMILVLSFPVLICYLVIGLPIAVYRTIKYLVQRNPFASVKDRFAPLFSFFLTPSELLQEFSRKGTLSPILLATLSFSVWLVLFLHFANVIFIPFITIPSTWYFAFVALICALSYIPAMLFKLRNQKFYFSVPDRFKFEEAFSNSIKVLFPDVIIDHSYNYQRSPSPDYEYRSILYYNPSDWSIYIPIEMCFDTVTDLLNKVNIKLFKRNFSLVFPLLCDAFDNTMTSKKREKIENYVSQHINDLELPCTVKQLKYSITVESADYGYNVTFTWR